MKLVEVSIKRPTLIVVLFTVLTLGGLLSYSLLNYELLPKFSPGVISVVTVYPGAAPGEVENSVSRKIEDAVASMENVKKIDAKSYENLSVVIVTLTNDADVDYALNDAQRKVNAVLKDLPEDIDPPTLNKFSLDDLPIITIAASANMEDLDFYDLMDNQIAAVISRVPGVAQVALVGGSEREYRVSVDADKLKGYGLSLLQVQQAVLSSNLDFPTGNVDTRDRDITIRLAGKYKSIEELRNLVIKTGADGEQVRLTDVAEVNITQKEIEKIGRVDQENMIALQVFKQSDANAVEVSRLVKQSVEKLEQDYSKYGLALTIASDSSEYTLASANAVIFDLVLAIVLVAIVMLFFLHSIRNAFIVMVAIPASLIATFIGMYLLGFSLNLMSLLALSLVVGILVDDAIVVLENIYRHMEMGKNKVQAAFDATKEIGFTVLSITLVIVVVFFPIALSSGMAAKILKEFALTVAIATMLSLLASFTIVPWLSSRFGKLEHLTGKNLFQRIILGFESGLNAFTEWMTGVLKWSLKHKLITLSIVFAVIASSALLFTGGYIGAEFTGQSDRGEFLVQIELPKDASIERTNELTRVAEEYLSTKPEVVRMITTVGQSSEGMGATQATSYKSEIKVLLVDKKDRKDDSYVYAAKVKNELEPLLVGAKVKTVPVSIMGAAENAPLALVVVGPNFDSVMSFAREAEALLKQIPGSAEVKLSVEEGNPEINVKIDRDKMAALHLNMSTVGATMQTAFAGNTDGKFRRGDYEYDINIRFKEFNRKDINDVRELTFTNDRGELVKLAQFAEVTEGSGPSMLERRDKSTAVTVQSQVVGRTTGEIAAEWQQQFEQLQRPAGVNYIWGGNMEYQEESFGTLGLALLVAIVLVYLILVALYDSFLYPFVVLFSIPLAIIGAFLALALTNNSLNIFTILGLIMLIGLVAKNAIILVDFTNHRKAEGMDTYNALIESLKARIRPILMTTIAMVFGMLPIAMASGAGAEWKNGLAWVIIGGLISSLFLTLIVVPVIYAIFDSLKAKVAGKRPKQSIEELLVIE